MSKTYFLLEVYNLCYEIILYMSYIEFKTKDQVSLIRRKAHNVEFIIDHSKKCKKCITKKVMKDIIDRSFTQVLVDYEYKCLPNVDYKVCKHELVDIYDLIKFGAGSNLDVLLINYCPSYLYGKTI